MNLKTMKLYSQVERVHNELRARGFDADAPLKVCDLTPFDQYHYFGSEAVDLAARVLGIGPRSRVLRSVRASAGRRGISLKPQAAKSLPWNCNVTCTTQQLPLRDVAALRTPCTMCAVM